MSRWSNTYKGNVHAQFNRWNKGDALDRKGPNLWYMKPRCYGKSSGSLNPPTWDDGSSTTGSTVSSFEGGPYLGAILPSASLQLPSLPAHPWTTLHMLWTQQIFQLLKEIENLTKMKSLFGRFKRD
jgi:hypothetical protein